MLKNALWSVSLFCLLTPEEVVETCGLSTTELRRGVGSVIKLRASPTKCSYDDTTDTECCAASTNSCCRADCCESKSATNCSECTISRLTGITFERSYLIFTRYIYISLYFDFINYCLGCVSGPDWRNKRDHFHIGNENQ